MAAVADAKAAVVAARDDVVLEDAVADEEASALVASDEGSTEPPAGLDVGYDINYLMSRGIPCFIA